MKNRIIYLLLTICLLASGCEQQKMAQPQEQDLIFSAEVTQLAYNCAKVRVTHTGDEDVTWHYFYCTLAEWKADEFLFENKYYELIETENFQDSLKKTKDRVVLLDLEEETDYVFCAYGVMESGDLYDARMASISFTTPRNIYTLKDVTEDKIWNISYQRDSKKEDIISVTSKREKGYVNCTVVPVEKVKEWDERNPDGFDMYENDILMYRLKNGKEMYVMQSIYDIQDQLTQGSVISAIGLKNSPTTPAKKNFKRLQSGSYYVLVVGFTEQGQHTQEYSLIEIDIPEDPIPTTEYMKWIGTYELSGMAEVRTDDNTQIEHEVTYTVKITGIDNNNMYRITGWECGDDIKEGGKWSQEVIDEGFKAYFKDGKLEIRESSIMRLSINEVEHELGIYGYGFNKIYNREMPVFFEDNPLAVAAPIKDGEDSTQLKPQTFRYQYYDANMALQEDNTPYTKMGIMAINTKDYSYMSKNPPLKLPLTMKKISE